MKLTGRTRYRVGWRGRLVLQVEWECVTTSHWGDRSRLTGWRDARVEDLSLEVHDA